MSSVCESPVSAIGCWAMGAVAAACLVLCLSFGDRVAAEEASEDPLSPVLSLIGQWEGEGSGMGGDSVVEHDYELVLRGNFLRLATLSVFEPQEGEASAERHEDIGLFSYDPDGQALKLRQFLSEGYVNTYVLTRAERGGRLLVFETEDTEGAGGMQARLTYEFTGDDEYRLSLDLASPGEEFFGCRSLRMKRSAAVGGGSEE